MDSKLESILKRISGKSVLKVSNDLRGDLELDSFKLMELTVEIHEAFSVDLGLKAMAGHKFETIEDIVKALELS